MKRTMSLRARRWTAALPVGAACILTAGLGLPARVQAGQTSVATAPSVSITGQPFRILESVSARFTLAGTSLPAADSVEFLLHRRVANRDSFRAIADNFAEPGVIDSAVVAVGGRSRNNNGTVSVSVAINTRRTSRNDLFAQLPGIYPVTVRVRSGEDVLASTLTFIDRRDAETVPTGSPASILAVLGGAVTHSPDGTSTLDDDARANISRFVDFLEAVGAPVTLQVQPELLDTLSESPETLDTQLLDRLRAALRGRSVIASTYTAVDPVAMMQDGLSSELTEQFRLGEATLNRLLPGVTIQRSTWVSHDPLDQRTIGFLQRLGIASVILMPSAAEGIEREGSPGIISRPAGSDSVSVMSVDTQLAATLDAATDNPTQVGVRLAAELIAQRDDLLARGTAPVDVRLVVASSSGELVDARTLVAVGRSLSNAVGLLLQDVGGPQTVDERAPATVFPAVLNRTLGGLKVSIQQARRELDAIQSMLPEDDQRRSRWLESLAISSSPGISNTSEFIDGLRSELRRLTGSVSLVTPSDITLSSRTGTIRLQLRNDEDVSLFVRIAVSSPKMQFTESPDIVELLPGGTTEVQVPVKARTNGRFPVTVRVVTPIGRVQVASPAVITARVSEVAGLGQLVSVTLLLMLLAWWWNSWRKGRREAHGDPSPDGGEGTVAPQ
ncbi:MAG: hypothetical protein RJB57_454 [Actinomycetota bacterium]